MKDALTADQVVAGIILIRGTQARALFDTDVSHYFVNPTIILLHRLEIEILPHIQEVISLIIYCMWESVVYCVLYI